jgi:hypothetical protein
MSIEKRVNSSGDSAKNQGVFHQMAGICILQTFSTRLDFAQTLLSRGSLGFDDYVIWNRVITVSPSQNAKNRPSRICIATRPTTKLAGKFAERGIYFVEWMLCLLRHQQHNIEAAAN